MANKKLEKIKKTYQALKRSMPTKEPILPKGAKLVPSRLQRTTTGWLGGRAGSALQTAQLKKGLPEAVKKVGGAIGKGIGTAMGFPFSALRNLRNRINVTPAKPELSPEEKNFRQRNLDTMRDTIKKWKESHPGYKIPKEFKDLE